MRPVAALITIGLLLAPAHGGHLVDGNGRKVFLRGVGWSPWHAVHGWGRPPEVVAQDYRFLEGMHCNGLRTWGPTSHKYADELHERGIYIVPQVGGAELPRSRFADGSPAPMPVWTDPQCVPSFAEKARALAEELRGAPGAIAYNLGNEYSCVGCPKPRLYQYAGFDEATLTAFRGWLRDRFPTPEAFEAHYGEPPPDFDTHRPATGTQESAIYGEWWTFLRHHTEGFFRAGHEALKAADAKTPTTYARLCGGRWDPATEDLRLDFAETVGDNLYYHWDKDWHKYCLRLARHTGTAPGKPVLLTETGINTLTFEGASPRLMKQMLMCSALHPEVAGIFIFVYCDEWWHGEDKAKQDCPADHWGLITADRKPKPTYHAAQEVYALFERMDRFLIEAAAPPLVIVSGQETDRWRGSQSTPHGDVVRTLYENGVPLSLRGNRSLLAIDPAECGHLILCDTHLWVEPDGSANVCEAVLEFARRGGRVLVLCEDPFQKVGGHHDVPAELREARGKVAFGEGEFVFVRELPAEEQLWPTVAEFLAEPLAGQPIRSVDAIGGDLIWRVLDGDGQRKLIVVNAGAEAVERAVIQVGAGIDTRGLRLYASDGARLVGAAGQPAALVGLDTYAVVDLPGSG